MSAIGRTLKVFVMGNEPSSLKTVELVNWTGLAFVGKRSHVSAIRDRPELSQPGIYLLLSEGADESSGLTQIYIGETEDFVKRLSDHARERDWWDKFVVFVSKDHNLTKAHVRYLEADLYKLAKQSLATLKIENASEPGGAQLPESDRSSMHEFLQNIKFVLETLGLSYFPSIESLSVSRASIPTGISNEVGKEQRYYLPLSRDLFPKGEPLKAHMASNGYTYILKAGSHIRREPLNSFEKHDSYFSLWKQISESDAVKQGPNEQVLTTVKDIEFRSPSAAAAVVKGGSANGRTLWRRTSDDKTLNECESEILTKSA